MAKTLAEVEGREASREDDKDDDDLDEEIKDEFCIWMWRWAWKDTCPFKMSWQEFYLSQWSQLLFCFSKVKTRNDNVQRSICDHFWVAYLTMERFSKN